MLYDEDNFCYLMDSFTIQLYERMLRKWFSFSLLLCSKADQDFGVFILFYYHKQIWFYLLSTSYHSLLVSLFTLAILKPTAGLPIYLRLFMYTYFIHNPAILIIPLTYLSTTTIPLTTEPSIAVL